MIRPIPSFAVAVAAALALVAGAASHATSLSELPLKASVLAKPNVIFGLDDSGSMDYEVMLYSNDGALWWDVNAGTGWGVDSAHPNAALRWSTTTWFNNTGNIDARWRKMVYLFPNGGATGARQFGDDAYHYAILPTAQLAFTRWSGAWRDGAGVLRAPSSDLRVSRLHNPLYYNPLLTYAPWAPAQLAGGAFTPANASTTATKSHPVRGSVTANLTQTRSDSTIEDEYFVALPGMRVPAGARKMVCNLDNASGCGKWVAVSTEETAVAGRTTRVAMAYFPATYWVREACTVPSPSNAASDDCSTLPDGSGTLRRYEIRSGVVHPSGRSHAAELQNFANWYQYHRKRRLMLSAAVGETLENLTGMRLGVVAFDNHQTVTMYDADATSASANRRRVAGLVYEAANGGGTPTRPTLKHIGEQYRRTDQSGGRFNVVQYACQRNNAFVLTDGFAQNDTVTPPNWDAGKSASSWGAGAPYEADFTRNGTLADLALRYYTNNPRPDLPTGALQATPGDTNRNLHMNTYALTLGARGTLFEGSDSQPPTTTAAWPDPNANRSPTAVDDLWRATLAGRGKLYLATTPDETALRIRAGLDDILSQEGAQGGVAVSAVNLDRSDSQAYLGVYNPRGWSGDLAAHPIDVATAAVAAAPNWSASALLGARDWTSRVVFSAVGGSGVDFTAATVGAALAPAAAADEREAIVRYLRGDRSGEGEAWRTRNSLIGAVVNAEPVLARDERTVYVASGNGLLHAFDTATGAEHWAFAPPDALPGIGNSVQRSWVYQTLLDATPVYGRLVSGRKMLVGGLGAAGRSYYALDVTAPRGLNGAAAAAQYRWTFPAAGDAANRALVGYTVGRPVLARTAADGDVVLVTSGYDNGQAVGDGRGRLWMLDAATGAVIRTFRTPVGAGGDAGLAQVSAFREPDGSVRYAYAGDLHGNLWRFDLARTGGGELDAELLATLRDGNGATQPVTAAPELTTVGSQRVVLVGTGRLLDIGDFGSTRSMSFYAIADGAAIGNARNGLVRQTYNRATDALSANKVDWTVERGWYVDLPAGEQANTDPIVAYGAVAFVTNLQGSANCTQSSTMYLVDIGTGSKVPASTFVASVVATQATSSRVITLRVVSGRIIGTTHRSDNTVYQKELPLGLDLTPAKNAWRELRR